MKKLIWVIVILAIVGVIWSFNQKTETPVIGGGVIKIGAIYALTGPAAKFGEISIQGVRDAVDYYKETNNSNIELTVEDSASDPKQGVSAINKLFSVNQIKFVVTGTSAVSAAVAPVAEQNKSFLISDAALLGLTKDKVYTLQNFMPSLNDIPTRLNANQEWKKVAVVYINDEFGNVWQDNIQKGISGTKEVKTFSFEKTTNDYRTESTKIKQFKPDVMVVLGYGPAFNQVLADITVLKIDVPIISYLACTLPGVLADKRFSLEGQYSYEYPQINNERVKTWIQKRGRDLNTFYTIAFENTFLALTAAEKSNNDPDRAIVYLKNNSLSGLWGDVKFGNDGVVSRDLVAAKIQSGICMPQ